MNAVTISKDDLINRFSIYDYVVCLGMLSLSAGIGIFYGCFGKKMQDTKEFLLAGKSMGTFPVAMSLIASFMSAITLLGVPTEVYTNGFTIYLSLLSYFIVMPVAIYIFLPVLWNLQLLSVNQYLEMRFSKPVRKLASIIYILQTTMYMAVVVYAPSLALAHVTGISLYVSVTTTFFVCIFYTSTGGMKAVLWADSLQVFLMYAAMLLIVCNGFIEEGGFMPVWEANMRGNRATLIDWDLNPTTRHTFWGLTIGYFFNWIPVFAINQGQVQRYLCVRNKQMAMRAIWITLLGFEILTCTCLLAGLLLYAKYENCDPVKSGLISKDDQLLPLYVMDTLGKWKGLPGLFVAGIFSGSLSSISTGMNALATITLKDFVKDGFYPNISEIAATSLSKVLSVFYGLLSLGFVLIAERMGNVLSVSYSIGGMMEGPIFGLFVLGMFIPWANPMGAFFGTLSGLAFTLWIGIGHQINVFNENIIHDSLPVNTSGCSNLNSTIEEVIADFTPVIAEENNVLSVYRLSYVWLSPIACLSTLFFGVLISLLTGFHDVKTLNPALLSPVVHWIKRLIPGGTQIGTNYEGNEKELKQETKNVPPEATNEAFSFELPNKPTSAVTGKGSTR